MFGYEHIMRIIMKRIALIIFVLIILIFSSFVAFAETNEKQNNPGNEIKIIDIESISEDG